eukprot:NODE_140_length_17926_cov_0.139620.p17 type:complete len:113 gc:universal NODE_140_length_17926_cov_0.139620:15426-15764(+)
MAPSTDKAIEDYLKMGRTKLLIVPIAFTSDHIETLYELDEEYIKEANDKGYQDVHRTEALNIHPTFIRALASLVTSKMSKSPVSQQLGLQCPHCTKMVCKETKHYFNQFNPQ